MTRAKDRGEGFRVAQAQQKRADRADERFAALRRELAAAQRELRVAGEDLALERECSVALARDLQEAQEQLAKRDARIVQLEAVVATEPGLIARLRARIWGRKPC